MLALSGLAFQFDAVIYQWSIKETVYLITALHPIYSNEG